MQKDQDAKLLINDILLGKIAEYTIQDNVFKGFKLQKTIEKVGKYFHELFHIYSQQEAYLILNYVNCYVHPKT